MNINKQIYRCNIRNEQDFRSESLNIPNEFRYPSRSVKQQVVFLYDNKEISIDITHYNREEIRHFKLWEGDLIKKNYLKQLSNLFLFQIKKHPLVGNLSIGVINDIEDEYGTTCYGAIKKANNLYFLIIYSKRGSSNFEDDIIYVFGLWEISLPNELKNKLFNPTNKSA